MSRILTIDEKLAVALEYSEAAYWSKLYDNQNSLACCSKVIAGAFTGAIPDLDILAMNRVIGLGMEIPVRPSDIDEIIDFYQLIGSKRFFVQVSPFGRQEDLKEMLQEKGFTRYNNWAKLIRNATRQIPEVKTDLKIESIRMDRAKEYGRIIFESFDWEDIRIADMLANSVGMPGYYHFFATFKGIPVGVAALHVMNEYASMAFAGTLPEYRGLGAQSLLLKTRIIKAAELGCKYIISETAEELADKPAASYRNMTRFGFKLAYLRENWIYEFL